MYQLVLYLCMYHSDVPLRGAAFSHWPIVWCTSAHRPIPTGEQFIDEDDCLDAASTHAEVLQTRPGWSQLTVSYRCEGPK